VKPLILGGAFTLQPQTLLGAYLLRVGFENLAKIAPKVSDRLRLRDYLSAYPY